MTFWEKIGMLKALCVVGVLTRESRLELLNIVDLL